MKQTALFFIFSAFAILISGCVSKTQYEDVINEHRAEMEKTELTLQKCASDAHDLKDQIDRLNRTLAEKEAIISLQKTAIRLVDDSDQTLQKSINEQLIGYGQDSPPMPPSKTLLFVEKQLFPAGSSDLTDQGKTILRDLQKELTLHPFKRVRIFGYTDGESFPKNPKACRSNRELSIARAAIMAEFLVTEALVPEDRIEIVGFGKNTRPASSDETKSHQINRRIEIIF